MGSTDHDGTIKFLQQWGDPDLAVGQHWQSRDGYVVVWFFRESADMWRPARGFGRWIHDIRRTLGLGGSDRWIYSIFPSNEHAQVAARAELLMGGGAPPSDHDEVRESIEYLDSRA